MEYPLKIEKPFFTEKHPNIKVSNILILKNK